MEPFISRLITFLFLLLLQAASDITRQCLIVGGRVDVPIAVEGVTHVHPADKSVSYVRVRLVLLRRCDGEISTSVRVWLLHLTALFNEYRKILKASICIKNLLLTLSRAIDLSNGEILAQIFLIFLIS